MIVEIWKKALIDINPDDLRSLAAAARERLGMVEDAPVNMYDLVVQAALRGQVQLPTTGWNVEDAWDDPLTPDEIDALAGAPPPASLKSYARRNAPKARKTAAGDE